MITVLFILSAVPFVLSMIGLIGLRFVYDDLIASTQWSERCTYAIYGASFVWLGAMLYYVVISR